MEKKRESRREIEERDTTLEPMLDIEVRPFYRRFACRHAISLSLSLTHTHTITRTLIHALTNALCEIEREREGEWYDKRTRSARLKETAEEEKGEKKLTKNWKAK